MDPATLAGSAIAILTPYVSKGAQELVETVGQVAYDHAKKLLSTLKARWSSDPVASDLLKRFETKGEPEKHGPVLEQIMAEKLTEDEQLRSEVEQTVNELGPSMDVFIEMAEGEDVTGLEAENLTEGDAKVRLKIDKGKKVRGMVVKNIGRRV